MRGRPSPNGYGHTAPVDTSKSNEYSLYNVAGNVWEWTADWWGTIASIDGAARIARGPLRDSLAEADVVDGS